jgi:hypothetical protein
MKTANEETTRKASEYEAIYQEGKKWKEKFYDDKGFMFSDAPEEEPYWLPTIINNSGKLHKQTNKVMDALENAIKYL